MGAFAYRLAVVLFCRNVKIQLATVYLFKHSLGFHLGSNGRR